MHPLRGGKEDNDSLKSLKNDQKLVKSIHSYSFILQCIKLPATTLKSSIGGGGGGGDRDVRVSMKTVLDEIII